MTTHTKRGQIAAINEDGDDASIYGWELSFRELAPQIAEFVGYPLGCIEDDGITTLEQLATYLKKRDLEYHISQNYGRWMNDASGEYDRVLWFTNGPKQGAFKITNISSW